MKKIKVAINGFGRIGRHALKIILARPDLEIVAINDLAEVETLAHLFKYDSVYGVYQRQVATEDGQMVVDDQKIHFFSEKDASKLPWGKLKVDVVIDSTGHYRTTELAKAHIEAGAKRVVISAPAKDDTKTIVIGVNDKELTKDDQIVSNASCTTNCLAPIMAVLEDAYGVSKSLMTTVHATTATQKTLDGPARDLRMSRAAGINIIPTTTGASKATARVLPSVDGKMEAMSIRVPVPTVSLIDLSLVLKQRTTLAELKKTLKEAAKSSYYQGIIDLTEEELVSSDMIGNPASSVIDLNLTQLVDGDLAKIVAWYDNEWGYSNRLLELVVNVGKLIDG